MSYTFNGNQKYLDLLSALMCRRIKCWMIYMQESAYLSDEIASNFRKYVQYYFGTKVNICVMCSS